VKIDENQTWSEKRRKPDLSKKDENRALSEEWKLDWKWKDEIQTWSEKWWKPNLKWKKKQK